MATQTGVIFNLKNNFGWRDKSEVDLGLRKVGDVLDELDDENDRDELAAAAEAHLKKKQNDARPEAA
jgi:hypothetical protein